MSSPRKVFLITTLSKKIQEILNDVRTKAVELLNIREKLSVLKSILSDIDISYSEGLKKLREFRNNILPFRLSPKYGEVEKMFIEALLEYVRTKEKMIFNYKEDPGAPTTNNKYELKYKQLKHFLRRVIGFASAKSYLLSHGERIVFVNIDESFSGILDILLRTDFAEAREIIRPFIMAEIRYQKKRKLIKNNLTRVYDSLVKFIDFYYENIIDKKYEVSRNIQQKTAIYLSHFKRNNDILYKINLEYEIIEIEKNNSKGIRSFIILENIKLTFFFNSTYDVYRYVMNVEGFMNSTRENKDEKYFEKEYILNKLNPIKKKLNLL